MKRILCIVGSMDAGGAETFLMKMYRNIDRSKLQMDFAVAKKEKGFYDDEIISLGGKIFHIIPKSKGVLKNFLSIKKIVKENKYESVLRISQHSLSSLELFAAKLGGAKKVAFRSSNTNSGGGKFNLLIHYLFRPISNMIVNVKIAPSTDAAIYMFGKKEVNKKNVKIIHNAINFQDYKFDIEERKKLRKEFNLDDKFVIGHIGRFNHQKNHKFLLEIFKEVLEKKDNSILVLIGKGELEQEIKEYAKELNIINKIMFLGVRKDANILYSIFDVFVFPSKFEGMPNTLIEAQANGLNCITSTNITKEANITRNIKYIDLNDKQVWIDTILNTKGEHQDCIDYFKKNKYMIADIAKEFTELFI